MAPQSSLSSTEPHVVDRLAEYYSGSLGADDELVIEGHLLSCADCRTEYDELGESALMVALQPPSALDDEPQPSGGHVPAARPIGQPSRGSSGPGTGRHRDPAGPQRSRRAGLRRIAGYAAVLVLGAALGVGGTVISDRTTTPPLQNVGGSEDISTDRMSVTVIAAPGGAQVQAAAVGLRPGCGFKLVAVDAGGRGYLVTTGVADGGLQSIVGTVPVAASEIVFVVLVEDDHGALLIARPS